MQQHCTEIRNSDWLKRVTRFVTSNQNALFYSKVVTIPFYFQTFVAKERRRLRDQGLIP